LPKQPGQTRFNPLLLYGGVGLGKTHLAQAINNYLLRRNVPLRLIYVSSEYFTTGYITALQQNRAHEFTAFYNSADVLIIDDVQFLAGKEKTQAHFFHIFNTLYQAGKQLVFTSDKSPRELTELDERLVSRLQWGLVAEILPPDFELRFGNFCAAKSADEGLQLPEEVLEYIAHAVTGSVRELEGCLIHLLARATLDRCEITLELAQHAVAALVGQGNPSAADPPPALTLERIAREVADYYGIPLEALRGKSRKTRYRPGTPPGNVPGAHAPGPAPQAYRALFRRTGPHHRHARVQRNRTRAAPFLRTPASSAGAATAAAPCSSVVAGRIRPLTRR
jgi:chromosomal replication initiator protein